MKKPNTRLSASLYYSLPLLYLIPLLFPVLLTVFLLFFFPTPLNSSNTERLVSDVKKQLALFERMQLAQQGQVSLGTSAVEETAAPSKAPLGAQRGRTLGSAAPADRGAASTAPAAAGPAASADGPAAAAGGSGGGGDGLDFSPLDRLLKHRRRPVSLLNKADLSGLSSAMRPRITVRDVLTHLEGELRFASSLPLCRAAALNLDPSYNAKQSDQQAMMTEVPPAPAP